jgi:hypothetical protein
MTSPGVNSGWRAPYLDNDQSWGEFRMEGPHLLDFFPGPIFHLLSQEK